MGARTLWAGALHLQQKVIEGVTRGALGCSRSCPCPPKPLLTVAVMPVPPCGVLMLPPCAPSHPHLNCPHQVPPGVSLRLGRLLLQLATSHSPPTPHQQQPTAAAETTVAAAAGGAVGSEGAAAAAGGTGAVPAAATPLPAASRALLVVDCAMAEAGFRSLQVGHVGREGKGMRRTGIGGYQRWGL